MIAQNTFTDGLTMDLNPLTTPKTVLTDALNATIITYNGEEFVLQNDMGNSKVERAKLSVGFIPLGMQEYGGIVYVASVNPETGEGEIGAFPSPERDFSTSDFENLAPAKFKTSDYVVNTGQTSLNEKTSVITKLVEPEILQLNPGDMFLVTYDIHDPTGADVPDEIDTKAKMDNYITSDVANRKLFRLKFYKITDDNNLNEINPDDIKLVDAADDLEGQYVYFKEKNKGTIAVGLELETLDSFDINVIDVSKRTDATKTAVIEAVGNSNSLADFEGVRVNITEPSVEQFFINKTADVRKISARLADLAPNAKLIGSVTPYSNYALYPKLKKDFNLEMGKYSSTGSQVNNIYRYYQGDDYVKVDFDFKFEGNNSNGLVLYVEFYDPWSDYSVVKIVDNPTYYGTNSVVMELVNEPRTTIFNSTEVGGTKMTDLIPNTDTTYIKTMLNTSGLIRTTSTLRRGHFYIVRISGVDVDVTVEPPTYKHYDFYKALYTNTMFNAIYLLQNTIPPTSPQYVGDFMTLDFDLSNVKFKVETKELQNINAPVAITNIREDLMTNNRYYKIIDADLALTPAYKHVRLFKNNKNHSLKLTLGGVENVFGNFKDELLSVTMPTLGDSNSAEVYKPTINDIDYDTDPDISPESYAKWSFTNIDSRNYQLGTEVTTKRSVTSNVLKGTILGNSYNEISLANQLYHKVFQGVFPTNVHAVLEYHKYSIKVLTPDNTVQNYTTSSGADDDTFNNIINDQIVNRGLPATSAIVMTAPEKTYFYPTNGYWDCASNDPNGTAAWKQSIMVVRRGDGGWRPTRTHDYDTMVDFWTEIKIASSVQKTMKTYYPSQSIKRNEQITTNVKFPSFSVTTNFNPSAPGVKTYLSKYILKAQSTSLIDFTTLSINDYIATKVGTHEIIDNQKTIRDGFIPYIDTDKHSAESVTIGDVNIVQSADATVVDRMAAGQSQIPTDPSLVAGRFPHGKIFTDKADYQQWVTNLSASGVNAGEINPNAITILFNNTGPEWIGKNSKVGRCDGGDDAPDMIPSIMITKS